MKVYVVTNGDYSDYRILEMFSTKEMAEEYKVFRNAENDIEEYELDPEFGMSAPKGMQRWIVRMGRDGNTTDPMCYGHGVERDDGEPDQWLVWRDWQPYSSSGGRLMTFSMWARDAEHAVKIANERRAWLIAEGLWDKYVGNWSYGARTM